MTKPIDPSGRVIDRAAAEHAAADLLSALGEFERIDYLRRPPSESKLRELLRKAGLRQADVVRTKGAGASGLQIIDDEATLRALPWHSELLQRPIAERVGRAVSARAPERVMELLG